jgi:hypothetical protein
MFQAQYPGQVILLLLFAAKPQQHRTEHLNTEIVVKTTLRHTGAGKLLCQNNLFNRRQSSATKFLRPIDRQQVIGMQRRAPVSDKTLLVSRSHRTQSAPICRQFCLKKFAD